MMRIVALEVMGGMITLYHVLQSEMKIRTALSMPAVRIQLTGAMQVTTGTLGNRNDSSRPRC